MQRPATQEIAQRAYELWERAGRVHGHDQQYWFTAERELTVGVSAAEDRTNGEIRGVEKGSAPQAKPAETKPPAQQIPSAVPVTREQGRLAGELRQAQQAGVERKSVAEPNPMIKAAQKAKPETDDLAVQLAELQRLMTMKENSPAKSAKPRAKKPVAEPDAASVSDKK